MKKYLLTILVMTLTTAASAEHILRVVPRFVAYHNVCAVQVNPWAVSNDFAYLELVDLAFDSAGRVLGDQPDVDAVLNRNLELVTVEEQRLIQLGCEGEAYQQYELDLVSVTNAAVATLD